MGDGRWVMGDRHKLIEGEKLNFGILCDKNFIIIGITICGLYKDDSIGHRNGYMVFTGIFRQK
jgi:hypothetical protein